jgi:hypothetical protein
MRFDEDQRERKISRCQGTTSIFKKNPIRLGSLEAGERTNTVRRLSGVFHHKT